jgi:hypothetical protein
MSKKIQQTNSSLFVPSAANSVEPIILDRGLRDSIFNTLWIYPAQGIDNATKKLTANVGSVWIGEKTTGADVTPAELPFDGAPFPIQLPPGQNKYIRDVLIQVDNAADGVWLKWWTDDD